jgi:hypothetical protein
VWTAPVVVKLPFLDTLSNIGIFRPMTRPELHTVSRGSSCARGCSHSSSSSKRVFEDSPSRRAILYGIKKSLNKAASGRVQCGLSLSLTEICDPPTALLSIVMTQGSRTPSERRRNYNFSLAMIGLAPLFQKLEVQTPGRFRSSPPTPRDEGRYNSVS